MPQNDSSSTDKSADEYLYEWKEIANFLRVTTKTAQKYETELQLPVKRRGNRVFISVSDLEEWRVLQTQVAPLDIQEEASFWNNPQILRRMVLVLLPVAFLGWAGFAWRLSTDLRGTPSELQMSGLVAVARDDKGRIAWQYRFQDPVINAELGKGIPYKFLDLDGDNSVETLLVWQHVERDAKGWGLSCIGQLGELKWQLSLDDELRSASGKTIGPPFVLRNYTVFDSPNADGTQWVAATFVHVNNSASALVIVDSAGKRKGTYWHSGHLNAIQMFDADGDGKREIVVGGNRTSTDHAVLIAFDPANVKGGTPWLDTSQTLQIGAGLGSEKLTAYMAPTTYTKAMKSFSHVEVLLLSKEALHAHAYESVQHKGAYVVYEFSPGMKIKELTLSAIYNEVTTQFFSQLGVSAVDPQKELARLRAEFRLFSHSAPR